MAKTRWFFEKQGRFTPCLSCQTGVRASLAGTNAGVLAGTKNRLSDIPEKKAPSDSNYIRGPTQQSNAYHEIASALGNP